MSGSLFQTHIIEDEIKRKYQLIVDYYETELRAVDICFNLGLNHYNKFGTQALSIDRTLPDVAGSLQWISMLRKRVLHPLQDLPFIEYP